MQQFPDKHGAAFTAYRELLPKRCADWPAVVRVKDPPLLAAMHFRWDHCQACGRGRQDRVKLELHHIVGGTKGRADVATNVIMLCRECHGMANTRSLPLATILWAKWRTDRMNTDWCELALLARHHLPDPLPDARLLAEYRRRLRLNRVPNTE